MNDKIYQNCPNCHKIKLWHNDNDNNFYCDYCFIRLDQKQLKARLKQNRHNKKKKSKPLNTSLIKLIEWNIGLLPVTVDIILIYKFPICIFLIPIALLVGMVFAIIFVKLEKSEYKPESKEYQELQQEINIGKLGLIAGGTSLIHNTKECIHDISDVDHWHTNV